MSGRQYWRVSTDERIHPLLRGQYVFRSSPKGVLKVNFSWTSYELFAIHPSLLLPLLPEVEARVNLILNWNEDHGGYIPEDADAAKIQRLYEMGEKIFWTMSKLEDETKERRGVDSLRFNDLAHAKQNAKILRVIAARPDDRVALNKVMDLWHQAQQFRLLAAQIVG